MFAILLKNFLKTKTKTPIAVLGYSFIITKKGVKMQTFFSRLYCSIAISLAIFSNVISVSYAETIQRQAYRVCKENETAYWNGSGSACCNGMPYEISQYQWACCQEPTPKALKDIKGNRYCCSEDVDYAADSGSQYQGRGCCLPGMMEMTYVYPQPTSSYDETNTSSVCCYPGENPFYSLAASYLGRTLGCCPSNMEVVSGEHWYLQKPYRGLKCCTPGSTFETCCQPGDNPQYTLAANKSKGLCCPEGATASSGRCCNSDEIASAYYSYVPNGDGGWDVDTFNDACCPMGKVYTKDGCCDASKASTQIFWDLGHQKKALRCV